MYFRTRKKQIVQEFLTWPEVHKESEAHFEPLLCTRIYQKFFSQHTSKEKNDDDTVNSLLY